MSVIYNKTLAFLQAQEREQESLYYEVKSLIKDSMNTKQDDMVTVALQQAQAENNARVWNTIQDQVIDIVNTFEYEKDGKQYVSHLLILPFMIFPSENTVTLPAIKEVESWWRKSLSKHFLTYPGALEFNMAPVVLSKNNAYTMSMTDWYQIHKANSLTLSKRTSRNMFVSPFSIKTVANQANLNFFVATLNFELENSSYTPLLSLTSQQTDELEICLFEINDKFFDSVENSQWLSMPIGSVNTIIGHAFETYQETILTNVIDKYCDNSEVRFILVPNNDQKFLTLCAWHESQNVILDAIHITQYIKDFSEITEFILNELENYEFTTLYVGNATISIEEFNNLTSLDIDSYIRENGINAVSTSSEDDTDY